MTDILDHLIRHRLPPLDAEPANVGRIEDGVQIQTLTQCGAGKVSHWGAGSSPCCWIGLGFNQHGLPIEFPVYIERRTARVPLDDVLQATGRAAALLRAYNVKSMHRAMMTIPGERGSQQPGDIERFDDYDGWRPYEPIPGLLTGPLNEIGHWVECGAEIVSVGIEDGQPWLSITQHVGGTITPGLGRKHRVRWTDTIDPERT